MLGAKHPVPPADRAALRRFGLVTGAALPALVGLAFPWLLHRPFPKWPWAAGALLLLAGLAVPNALALIHRPWMRAALLLNRVTTPIIAGAIFFLVISPIGWIMRRMGNDPMARRFDSKATSYRVPSRKPAPNSVERPF
jgi:Saxitoxin biosynthesis operon protein SxtJ